jgi:hypothetical protein
MDQTIQTCCWHQPSDEDESNGNPEDEPANTGSKCKVGKKASSASKKLKLNEAPKIKQGCKRACVDSEDVGSTDENADHMEDQADAYEQLRPERKTDQPVCGAIKIISVIVRC